MTRPSLSSERGFTIVETMVAMVVLVVGLIGVAGMMDHAVQASVTTKAREGGVALQREIVETAKGLAYDSLTPSSVVSQLRAANPGLVDAGDPGWQIKRRNITYTISVGVCSVDDPSDLYGTHDAATFCATGAGKATAAQCRAALGTSGSIAGEGIASGYVVGDCGLDTNANGSVNNLTENVVGCVTGHCADSDDKNPDDYKRIVVLVRWSQGGGPASRSSRRLCLTRASRARRASPGSPRPWPARLPRRRRRSSPGRPRRIARRRPCRGSSTGSGRATQRAPRTRICGRSAGTSARRAAAPCRTPVRFSTAPMTSVRRRSATTERSGR